MSGNMSKTSERSIVVTTDRSRLDLDTIHGSLTTSYWARGIPRETVARSMENSMCFGAPAHPERQMEVLVKEPYRA